MNCTACQMQGIDRQDVVTAIEARDDSIYKWTCPNGHEVVQPVLNERFEILFEFGLMALLDSYSREAVSSFAASLERFHEFCVEVIMNDNGIAFDNFQGTWKFVARQSERQLGAFLFLYLQKFGDTPPWKEVDKWTKFRNDVIHQGYIPSSDEVMKYAAVIYEYILKVSKLLQEKCKSALHTVLIQHEDSLRKRAGGGPMAWRIIQTVIHLTMTHMANVSQETFEQGIERLKSNFKDGWVYSK